MALSKLKTQEAHNAQQRVQDALARGEIKRPTRCQGCGKAGPVEFAHSNYDGRLAGKWLCPSCHHTRDGKSPNGGGSGRAGTEKAS